MAHHHPRYADAINYRETRTTAPATILMLGMTRGGRRLTIVIRYDSRAGSMEPITGWESSPGEREKYF